MKSVGEAMAIGRTLAKSLQKALRWLETGLSGVDPSAPSPASARATTRTRFVRPSGKPTPTGWSRARGSASGLTVEEISRVCHIDPWFLPAGRRHIVRDRRRGAAARLADGRAVAVAQGKGFSDARLATLAGKSESEVATLRAKLDVHPVYKRIDTCAAEFASPTAYLYSTYEMPFVAKVPRRRGPAERPARR